MKKLGTLTILILMTIALSACRSQANLVRSSHGQICKDVKLPDNVFIQDGEIIFQRNKSYVYSERYINLVIHAGKLVECGKASQCVIRWTEYERDCEIEQRTFTFLIFGYRKTCSIPEPEC